MEPQKSHFTEPTTNYWQTILPASSTPPSPPYQFSYPAVLPSSAILPLPIRALHSDPGLAVASLIINQASLSVTAQLGALLADRVRVLDPEVIIGLPTLGLSLAPIVAQALGFDRYVPLGYSRKFWYKEELSTAVSSITSPDIGVKKAYLDPNQLSLVLGKRVVIIDDVVSSGSTVIAVWEMLEGLGCDVRGCGVVMKQGNRWEKVVGEERKGKLIWVMESPLLRAVEGGWDVRE